MVALLYVTLIHIDSHPGLNPTSELLAELRDFIHEQREQGYMREETSRREQREWREWLQSREEALVGEWQAREVTFAAERQVREETVGQEQREWREWLQSREVTLAAERQEWRNWLQSREVTLAAERQEWHRCRNWLIAVVIIFGLLSMLGTILLSIKL